MIKLVNLEKWYPIGPSKYFVLRRINMEVKDGGFITIMGPSGAGKCTLLSILGMLDASWSGEFYFLDEPVHRLNAKRRAELNKKYIGLVFEKTHLLHNRSVATTLAIPPSSRDVRPS